MASVMNHSKRSRKSGYPGKSKIDSNISVDNKPSKPSTVNNYYVGSSRHEDYRAIEEERQARITKEKEQADKLKAERKLLEQKADEEKELESITDFEEYKKSRWEKHSAKRKSNKQTAEDIIKEGGDYIAEDLILNELGNAVKPLRNGLGYAKNKILDVVENPKNRKAVTDTIKGIGKTLQDTTQNLNKDILAYGQAKALINGTGEYTEKIVKDKYGNVVGVERNFKQHGKDNNKKDNTFGLKPVVQPRKSKPGPIVRKATIIARKGTLAKNRKSMWDKEEKAGPTNHRRSDVALTKKDTPGIGRHVKSGVKLIKSSLPTLETYDEAEPNIFSESNFQGFAKKSFAGFAQKAQFHPINRHRQRAGFESTVTP